MCHQIFSMSWIYSFLYNSQINWLLRNFCYFFKGILPEKFQIHPSGTLRLKVEQHTSIFLKTNQTSYVSKQLFWNGAEHYEFTPVFLGLVKKIDVFFDIGSSIGYYSLLGAKVNKHLQVVAFEPSVGSMAYLKSNIELNDFSSRIQAEALALSDRVGAVEFLISETPNIRRYTIYRESITWVQKLICPTIHHKWFLIRWIITSAQPNKLLWI